MRADNPPLILLLLPLHSQGHINETTVPRSLSFFLFFKGFFFFLRLAGYCLKERSFLLKVRRVSVEFGEIHKRVAPVTSIRKIKLMILADKDVNVTIKDSDLRWGGGKQIPFYKIKLNRMPSHNCQKCTDMLKTLLILTVSFRLYVTIVLCELCCDHHYPGIACCVLSCLWIS